jgi:nitrogen fixation-related uncharacterized protein
MLNYPHNRAKGFGYVGHRILFDEQAETQQQETPGSCFIMKSSVAVALIIGFVIGYNCYLHVWDGDLLPSSITAVVASVGFLLWFGRMARHWESSIKSR